MPMYISDGVATAYVVMSFSRLSFFLLFFSFLSFQRTI